MRANTIHSIVLSDPSCRVDTTAASCLSSPVRRNFSSIKEVYPDHDHRVYGNQDIAGFLSGHFGADANYAYSSLVPLAYKADLARYCVMYLYGGIYADLSIFFFSSIYSRASNTGKTFIFSDTDHSKRLPWMVSNGLFASYPGNPLFLRLIHLISENVRSKYYGINSLSPSGPNLFGRAIAAACSEHEIVCGQANRINRKDFPNFSYLSPSGDLVAVSHKHDRGFSGTGMPELKSYKTLYAEKCIYSASDTLLWGPLDFYFQGWSDSCVKASLKAYKVICRSERLMSLRATYALAGGTYVCTFVVSDIALANTSEDLGLSLRLSLSSGEFRFQFVLDSDRADARAYKLNMEMPSQSIIKGIDICQSNIIGIGAHFLKIERL